MQGISRDWRSWLNLRSNSPLAMVHALLALAFPLAGAAFFFAPRVGGLGHLSPSGLRGWVVVDLGAIVSRGSWCPAGVWREESTGQRAMRQQSRHLLLPLCWLHLLRVVRAFLAVV